MKSTATTTMSSATSSKRSPARTAAPRAAEPATLTAQLEAVRRSVQADATGLIVYREGAAFQLASVPATIDDTDLRVLRELDAADPAPRTWRHAEQEWSIVPFPIAGLREPWAVWCKRDRDWNAGDVRRLQMEAAELASRLPQLCALEIDCLRSSATLDQAAWIAGRLAHDFGNLLTGILGFAELALNQIPPGSLPHRYLTEVWQSSRQGAHWVQQLQRFGRRGGNLRVPANVLTGVAEQAAAFKQSWPECEVASDVPQDLPEARIEPDALSQVLSQLLSNAGDACGGRGVVHIQARLLDLTAADCLRWVGKPRPGPAIEIAVTDNGVGLKTELRERLFHETFFSTKPRHRGLGLAIVYGLLQAYHGGLRLDDHLPHGVVARIVMPVRPAPAPDEIEQP